MDGAPDGAESGPSGEGAVSAAMRDPFHAMITGIAWHRHLAINDWSGPTVCVSRAALFIDQSCRDISSGGKRARTLCWMMRVVHCRSPTSVLLDSANNVRWREPGRPMDTGFETFWCRWHHGTLVFGRVCQGTSIKNSKRMMSPGHAEPEATPTRPR